MRVEESWNATGTVSGNDAMKKPSKKAMAMRRLRAKRYAKGLTARGNVRDGATETEVVEEEDTPIAGASLEALEKQLSSIDTK